MFPIRLKALRKGQKISLKQLAENLNKYSKDSKHHNNPAQIGNWERGVRSPSYLEIKKLSSYFNVSMDYLIGRTSIQHFNLETVLMSENKITFNDQTLTHHDRYEIFQLINVYLHGKDNNNTENKNNEYQESLNLDLDDDK
ncbi:XRE family transcriptional regulator [Apilactobacillus micheneri]|uniref:helix-turn-helix domain-containing protein n=1 Tax=Apilactobacillus micheneri TaxID=1899430 RepID=UPI00112D60BF|nr:helix-turn-helix transcriptional regulator [Apilactobacillus micheneri]TPR45667.1 XRE family transcriptional regulator [Apilactobacillus micheneri]TPR49114.1 XRE family transcriptional regulator [Apilactobacillus micheneri]